MRISTFTLLMCSCLFTLSLTAQNEINLQELLNRLSDNHMGSISDVFSNEEIAVLNQHYASLNTEQTEKTALINRKFSSTKGNTPVAVVTIDLDDLSLDNIGPSPLTEFEGAGVASFSPSINAFIITNDNRLHIRGVDDTNYIDNGAITNIVSGQSITGAELLSNGDIYMIGTNGVDNSSLYKLDPMAVSATQIGGNNGLILPINLLRDPVDNLFTLDIDDDSVYGIDKTTGVVQLVGPAGFDANFGQGGSFDPEVNKTLLTAFNNTLFDSELRELDTTTGLTTSLGTITPGDVDQFGWSGYYDADVLDINENMITDFNFYPNPVSERLILNAPNSMERVTIFSIEGRMILNKSLEGSNAEINVEQLPAGMYLLKVQLNNNSLTTQFIKD